MSTNCFPPSLRNKHVGDERAIGWVSRAQVDIQKSVVIHIAEICAHGHKNLFEAYLLGYIVKGSVPFVFVELQGDRR